MYNNQDLDFLTNLILSTTKPVEVSLFGSYATNNATNESDIDLLILLDIELSRSEKRRILTELRNKIFSADKIYAVDFLINTITSFENQKNIKGSIFYEINKTRKILWNNS